MSIEILVRPASAVSVLKNQAVQPVTASEDNDAVIEWGNGPLGLAERTNVYDTWDGGGGVSGPSNMHILDETGRRTHVVRVYNPDNQNIWVDVEVIDSLEMVGMSGIYMWNFSNPA
ncbi:MAG: hypothetical protein CFE34_19350 [Rhodobacteraceae bacterium PARR1]|nr:MAG: hypothetical protein CFE34_19350 [Rhodobacteraceae bacterium PARR1]